MEFVDFVPRRLRSGNIFRVAIFESFETLVERLNEWIKQNPDKRVVACETLESYEFWDGSQDTSSSTFNFNVRYRVRVNNDIRLPLPWRGRHWLRAWVAPSPERRLHLQEIGYLSVSPLDWTYTENDSTIGKPNVRVYPSKIHRGYAPLGQILNASTFTYWGKFAGKKPENITPEEMSSEKTYYQLKPSKSDHQIQGIRVFYDKNKQGPGDLYFCDFISNPQLEERCSDVFRQLQSWLLDMKSRARFELINIETVSMIQPLSWNSMNGLFAVYPLKQSLTFLRVHFSLNPAGKQDSPRSTPTNIQYTTCFPQPASGMSLGGGSYEKFADMVKRELGGMKSSDSLWGVSTIRVYPGSGMLYPGTPGANPERMSTALWKVRGRTDSFTMLRGARIVYGVE